MVDTVPDQVRQPINTPVAPEVADEPVEEDSVASKIDLLDEAIGHSYDILDTITGIDDDLTVLDFTISDLMDRLEDQEAKEAEV